MASAASLTTKTLQATIENAFHVKSFEELKPHCNKAAHVSYHFSGGTSRVRKGSMTPIPPGIEGVSVVASRIFKGNRNYESTKCESVNENGESRYVVNCRAIYTKKDGSSSPVQGIAVGRYDLGITVTIGITEAEISSVKVVERIISPITDL